MKLLSSVVSITVLSMGLISSGILPKPAYASELSATFLGIRLADKLSLEDAQAKLRPLHAGVSSSREVLAQGVLKHPIYVKEVNPYFKGFKGSGVFLDNELAFASLILSIPVTPTPAIKARKQARELVLFTSMHERIPLNEESYAGVKFIVDALYETHGEPRCVEDSAALDVYNDVLREIVDFRRSQKKMGPGERRRSNKQYFEIQKRAGLLKKGLHLRRVCKWVADNGQTEIRLIKKVEHHSDWKRMLITIAFVNLKQELLVRDRINNQPEVDSQKRANDAQQLKKLF